MTAVGFCLRAVNLRALRFGLVVLEANSETNLSLSVEFAAASGGRKKTGIEAYCVCRNGILLAVHFDEPAYRAGIFLVDSPAGDNLRVLQKSRHGQAKNYVRRRQRDSASIIFLSEVFFMNAGDLFESGSTFERRARFDDVPGYRRHMAGKIFRRCRF